MRGGLIAALCFTPIPFRAWWFSTSRAAGTPASKPAGKTSCGCGIS